ncbi:unnamed protein product [Leuciscus chuanchicus]
MDSSPVVRLLLHPKQRSLLEYLGWLIPPSMNSPVPLLVPAISESPVLPELPPSLTVLPPHLKSASSSSLPLLVPLSPRSPLPGSECTWRSGGLAERGDTGSENQHGTRGKEDSDPKRS